MLDILIIGAGPIGLFSGFYAGLKSFKGAIIESDNKYGGQLNLYKEKFIYDIPGQSKVTAGDLIEQLYQQYIPHQENIPLYLNEDIKEISINVDQSFTIITNKQRLMAKTILITTGSGRFVPRKIEAKGGDNPRIVYTIKNSKDYLNQDVAILGGGDSAIDWSLALEKIVKTGYLIHRREEFRAHEHSIQLLKASSIKLLTPYIVKEVQEINKQLRLILENVKTQKIENVDVDHIIVNYGTIPANLGALASMNLSLTANAEISIASDCSTNIAGVFAAGNSVSYQGKVKTLACGFGEVPVAINSIDRYLNPGKNKPFVYSSIKK